MYLNDSMLDRALPDGAPWPSDAHRVVASNVLLCNPRVRTMDALSAGVEIVLSIPEERIKTVTLREMIEEFNFPEAFLPAEVMG